MLDAGKSSSKRRSKDFTGFHDVKVMAEGEGVGSQSGVG